MSDSLSKLGVTVTESEHFGLLLNCARMLSWNIISNMKTDPFFEGEAQLKINPNKAL